jgi:hypothetical protein
MSRAQIGQKLIVIVLRIFLGLFLALTHVSCRLDAETILRANARNPSGVYSMLYGGHPALGLTSKKIHFCRQKLIALASL